MHKQKRIDVVVSRHSSIVTLLPLTRRARTWIDKNCCAESWQWTRSGLAVDSRYASEIVAGLTEAGFALQT